MVIQTFNDQSEAIRQHREGVIRLLHVQLGDLSRQLKKQIAKPLALAYSPLGDKAQLEQMLIYATLQSIICDVPVNLEEFQNLQLEVKRLFSVMVKPRCVSLMKFILLGKTSAVSSLC